jgi:hypothetical protein
MERGLTRSQAIGKPKAGEQPASRVERDVTVLGPDGPEVVTVVGTKERSRAGSLDNDVGELLAGRLDMRTYDRRWKGRSIGGVPVPDSRRVLALGRAGRVRFSDFYPTSPGAAA